MVEKELIKVSGLNLPISPKHAIELCTFIRGKNLTKIKNVLNLVINEKEAIQLRRFKHKRGHKKGKKGPGFYPKKASKYFLELLNTLEGNAKNQGIDITNLVIEKAMANRASISWHYGRHRGRRTKRSHVELYAYQKILEKALPGTFRKSFTKNEKSPEKNNEENLQRKDEKKEKQETKQKIDNKTKEKIKK